MRGQLAANGSITVRRGRALGVFPTRVIALNRPGQARLLRERTRGAVLGDRAAAAAIEDAAMAAIAAEGGVRTVFTPKERWQHRAAFTALNERFDSAVPALRDALRTAVAASRSASS
ncbi:GPP34 family phosphoprotein [Marinitenerispora sediminis]|uniref:GPP34 family phosphoprotein n=1 Tax=Marinitenerispora sediminis TaxID=1931232 RepID=UPI002867CCB6|nr:GPP34 family phosphoprotein [Marinitenerispora sediminis]